MQLDEAYRAEVQRQLIHAIIIGLESSQLKDSDLPEIAAQILDGLPVVNNHQQLIALLEKLGQQWEVFTKVANTEMARMIETKKDGVVNQALALARQGNIEDALAVAKTLTSQTV